MNLIKRIYSFITRANQVLFFLGICIVLAVLGFALYKEIFRATYYDHGPQVRIENPNTEKDSNEPSPPATITDIDVLYRDEVVTIIGIWKSQIQKPNGDKAAVFESLGVAKAASSVAEQARMYNDRGALVNLRIFKTGSSSFRNLLPSDGLIIGNDYDLRQYAPQPLKTPAFIFEVVTDDTNNDSTLTREDDRSLILVDRALEKPDLKIPNFIRYGYSSSGKIVVRTKNKNEVRFLEVDLATFKTSEIPWQ